MAGALRWPWFISLLGAILAALALSCLAFAPSHALAAEAQAPTDKDETVYVYTDATGSVKNAEVSVLLKNDDAANELRDSSNLTDLVGKDDASFTKYGTSIVWNAEGKDVSYTGTTTAKVPITLKVTYTLDGKTVTPDQLAGKSGHVTISYKFTNRSSTTAEINGTCEEINTPFTCITAIMLDGNDFKNVTVENCKVINDGDDMIVAGYAMPGLKESLGSIVSGADIPDSFSVSADVTAFELKSTMTVVTPGILSDINADSLDIGFDGDTSELADAMDQLISGSDSLTNGLEDLAESLSDLEYGTEGIKSGAEKLSGGLEELSGDNGLDALAQNMKDLESGTKGILDGSEILRDGLEALAGDEGLKSLAENEKALADAIGELGDEVAPFKEELSDIADELSEAGQYTETFNDALDIMQNPETMQKLVESGALTSGQYNTIVTALGIGSVMSSSVSDVANELDGASGKIETLENSIDALEENAVKIADGILYAADTANDLAGGAEYLAENARKLADAAPELTEGATSAADAASQLADGAKELEGYADQLNDAAPALAEGAQAAADGSKTLADGMRTLNDEGISQLVNAIQEKLGGIADRINALSDASRSYTNFSGITIGTNGSVKFVIETDPIKKA